MDFSSLPRYPTPGRPQLAGPQAESGWHSSRRAARVFRDLAWLAGIAIFLLWLRNVADTARQPPQPWGPLEFQLIQERFRQLQACVYRKQVFDLLGPPQFSGRISEPEFEEINALVQAHPDRYPHECSWAKWADPADEGKWVAVFFSGDRVERVLKKGF